MKPVPVADILAKIPTLPLGYASHVHLGEIVAGLMLSEVDSFSEHAVPRSYMVSIKRGDKAGELITTCTCPARTLCKHVIAFYAVAKADDPAVVAAAAQISPQSTERPHKPPQSDEAGTGTARMEGLRLIALAQEEFAQANQHMLDGLALLRKED